MDAVICSVCLRQSLLIRNQRRERAPPRPEALPTALPPPDDPSGARRARPPESSPREDGRAEDEGVALWGDADGVALCRDGVPTDPREGPSVDRTGGGVYAPPPRGTAVPMPERRPAPRYDG